MLRKYLEFRPPCGERTQSCVGYFPTEAFRRMPSLAGTVPTGKGPTCVRPSRLSGESILRDSLGVLQVERSGIYWNLREISGMLRKFLEVGPSARLVGREPGHTWDIFPPHVWPRRYSTYRKGPHVCETLAPFRRVYPTRSPGGASSGTERNPLESPGNLWNAPEMPGIRPFRLSCGEIPSHTWDISPPKPCAACPASQVQRLQERAPRV